MKVIKNTCDNTVQQASILFIPSTLRTKQLRRFRNKIALPFSYFHFRSARTLFHFLSWRKNETKKKRLHLTQDYARDFPLFLRSNFSSLSLIFFYLSFLVSSVSSFFSLEEAMAAFSCFFCLACKAKEIIQMSGKLCHLQDKIMYERGCQRVESCMIAQQ